MKIRPLIFAAICGLSFLSVSCSDSTSETVADNGTVTVDPPDDNEAKKKQADLEYFAYRQDCESSGPIPSKTLADGSRASCPFKGRSSRN